MLLLLVACAYEPTLDPVDETEPALAEPSEREAVAGPTPAFTGPDRLTGGLGYACRVASAGDVNADGYDDVLVVDCTAYTVAVFHGSASGVSTTAARTLTGSSAANFGASVAGRGDLNGDGYDDIAVGAPLRGGGRGSVSVWYGSASGIGATPSITLNGSPGMAMGGNVDLVGDVNGDGYDDLATSSGAGGTPRLRVYRGGASGLNSSLFWGVSLPADYDSSSGQSLRRAGDLNGDGFADVVVGAPDANAGAGAFRVYYGSTSGVTSTNRFGYGLDVSYYSTAAMGWSVSAAGDVDGDGYGDLLVGAPWMPYYGLAFLFYGSGSGLTSGDHTEWVGDVGDDADMSGTGYAVIGGANFNGDGYADIALTVPGRWNGGYGASGYWGASEVYVGDPAFAPGCGIWCPVAPEALLTGQQMAGRQLDIGDVNGDGCDDLLESESWDWTWGPFTNRANIYYASCGGGGGGGSDTAIAEDTAVSEL